MHETMQPVAGKFGKKNLGQGGEQQPKRCHTQKRVAHDISPWNGRGSQDACSPGGSLEYRRRVLFELDLRQARCDFVGEGMRQLADRVGVFISPELRPDSVFMLEDLLARGIG